MTSGGAEVTSSAGATGPPGVRQAAMDTDSDSDYS
jgi:hypothetical protein